MTSYSNLQFLIELTIASNSDFHQDWIHTHTPLNLVLKHSQRHPPCTQNRSQHNARAPSFNTSWRIPCCLRPRQKCNGMWGVCRHRFSSGIGVCTLPHSESSQCTVTTNPYLHFLYLFIPISFISFNIQQSMFCSSEIDGTRTCSI